MDSDFGSGSDFMNESNSGSGFMNDSDSGSGFMNISGSGSGSGPNQSVALCLNITIFGDDIVEGVENIFISFMSLNSQVAFVGPSDAVVNIMDDDGEH